MITIRRFEPSEDLDTFYNCYLDTEYSEFFRRVPTDLSRPELATLDNPNNRVYTIYSNNCDRVGFIVLNNFDPYGQSAHYGILIIKNFQDKYYEGKSKLSFISSIKFHQFIFTKTFINKLSVRVLSNRLDLVNNLERCGYSHEGHLRQAVLFNGTLTDEIEMAVFRGEFLERFPI